jgi:hypothetical protein
MPDIHMTDEHTRPAGSIQLDNIEVIIREVPIKQLDTAQQDAIMQLTTTAIEQGSNYLYSVNLDTRRRDDYTNPVYDIIYTACACRVPSDEL